MKKISRKSFRVVREPRVASRQALYEAWIEVQVNSLGGIDNLDELKGLALTLAWDHLNELNNR